MLGEKSFEEYFMANLTITFLGLNRLTVSMGMALRRYVAKGGKHKFNIIGSDLSGDDEKQAKKLGAIDKADNNPAQAVKNADIVVMAMSYEEVEATYKAIRHDLRDGVVILDCSPLKQPSLDWAKQYLLSDHHIVGMTAILNPRYLFNAKETIDESQEDLFDESAILLTPAASCVKEAVDLAFNFASILGSKPRFLDPLEHDTLLAQTVQLPRLLGTMLFYNAMQQANWEDLKWFTNPDFGALTRPLFDIHPDALRDEFHHNRAALGRAMDSYIQTLQAFRQVLDDEAAIEALTVDAAKQYENWINSRYRADWDAASRGPEPKGGTILQGLVGSKLADKLSGKKDDEN
jgi:prephenate dehydrogenase